MCGEWKCPCCQEHVQDPNHRCYLRSNEPKDVSERYCFFDFETYEDDSGKHVPNLVVAHISCKHCLESDEPVCSHCGKRCPICDAVKDNEYVNPPCDGCGQREVVFKGTRTQQEFGEWLFADEHVGMTWLAHNMKGFDGYYLLDYLITNGIKHKVIFNGSKIMSINIQSGLNIRVIDSLLFLPMKLAKLPKTFGLPTLKKGDFPHKFNKPCNWDYVGPYPEQHYYGVDYMSTEDRDDFLQWHKEQDGKVFDFQKEILSYCQSDVQILRQACLHFRDLMLSVTGTKLSRVNEETGDGEEVWVGGVDPFQYLTIASVCMATFKHKFLVEEWEVKLEGSDVSYYAILKEGKLKVLVDGQWVPAESLKIAKEQFLRTPLGQVPAAGYVKHDNHSKESLQWLEWIMHTEQQKGTDIHIQHALNGVGEYRIPGTKYRADGWCVETNTIYEFYGCLFHGCETCFPERDVQHPRTKEPVSILYIKTKQREEALKKLGYKVVACWEHDFHNMLKTKPGMKAFVDSLDIQESS